MTSPRDRADDRLAAWAAATDRPVPGFARRASRRRRGRVGLAVAGVTILVLGALVVAVVVVGGGDRKAHVDTTPSAELAQSAARALARAPGMRYALTVAVTDSGTNEGLRSTGEIDFVGERFAGTADAGPDGQFMLLFGGPSNGAVIKAGEMFVQTEGGPWVRSDVNPQFDAITSRAIVSQAFASALGLSDVDPAIRTTPCGTTTCRLITVAMPNAAFFALERAVFGDATGEPPADLRPVVVQVVIDPSTGLLAGLEAQTTAGTTTIRVQLVLTQLDTAPKISPPIP